MLTAGLFEAAKALRLSIIRDDTMLTIAKAKLGHNAQTQALSRYTKSILTTELIH